MTIRFIKLDPCAKAPSRAHPSDAGNDLCALEDATISPGQRQLIKTGLAVAIPEGYYGRIADRSGLALKYGISIKGGVIDSLYRGEIGVILINEAKAPQAVMGGRPPEPDNIFYVKAGDKIAQLIITPCAAPEWVEAESLDDTSRGAGGYGSTGA